MTRARKPVGPCPAAIRNRPPVRSRPRLPWGPGAAVAGQGFTAGLLVSNMTPLLQQVSVAVGDASGFVMSGTSRLSCQSLLVEHG